jgi:hypothetical protein
MQFERERRRAEILAAIDAAEESLARGEGMVITKESMRQLAEDVTVAGENVWRWSEKHGADSALFNPACAGAHSNHLKPAPP